MQACRFDAVSAEVDGYTSSGRSRSCARIAGRRTGETTAPPDYDHYVTQQLQPIADAILRFVEGPDFEDIIGARKQLSLF